MVKAVGLSFFLTFIPFFDIPVFWPILVIYFFALCFMTMRRQIAHMWKHKYIPFDIGKKTYKVRATPTAAILRAARLLAARSVVEWDPDVRLACSALLVLQDSGKRDEALPGTTPLEDEAQVVSAPKSFTPPPGVSAPPSN